MEQTMFQWSRQLILESVSPVLRGLKPFWLLIFRSRRNHLKCGISWTVLRTWFQFFNGKKVSISWTIVIYPWPIFILSNEYLLGLFSIEEFLIYFLTILVWHLLHVFCHKSLRRYDDCSFQCCLYRFTAHCSCLIWQGEPVPRVRISRTSNFLFRMWMREHRCVTHDFTNWAKKVNFSILERLDGS